MSHWVYPANTKIYKVLEAFSQNEAVWPINSKIEVGDTVYIYLAAPYKKIGFICDVKAINLSNNKIREYTTPYLKSATQNKPADKAFMMLNNIRSIFSESLTALSYENLKINGLDGMLMGPRKLENNIELLNYIKGHEDGI